MPRNHLKRFPTAMLRRGMVHFHPGASSPGPNLTGPPVPPAAPVPEIGPAPVRTDVPTPPGADLRS